jgi:DNA-binding transcriptional ArsR family regulator
MVQIVDDRKSATIERRAKLFRGFADLRCLLDCGLVASDRDGRFIRYRISSPRITVLLSDVDALLDVVAEGVEACDNYRGA